VALRAYADASLLVALFSPDPFEARAQQFVEQGRPTLLVSDFAAAEFASALGIRVRTRNITRQGAQAAFSSFDAWARFRRARLETTTSDVAAAEGFLRRLELTLRTADALNIAIARRHGAALATFDVRMAEAARALGLEVADA
jgi:predicted nucleic acid-binding protein